MEYEGVKVDTDFLKVYSEEIADELRILQDTIFDLSGMSFNLDSPKQLGEILFEKLKIPYEGKKQKQVNILQMKKCCKN